MSKHHNRVIGYCADGVSIFSGVHEASSVTGVSEQNVYKSVRTGTVSSGWSFDYWNDGEKVGIRKRRTPEKHKKNCC